MENPDRLVSRKNQEISELNSRLVTARQKISELDDETEKLESKIQNLESQLAERSGENSTPIAIGGELPEPADLLNQLKARRRKSTVTLPDIEAILEMIAES